MRLVHKKAIAQPYALSWSFLRSASAFGPIAVYAYIIGFVLPFQWDIPLLVLALMSILAIDFPSHQGLSSRSTLTLPLLLFLGATGISMLLSEDVGRSIRLSAPLLPALLLFLLTERFRDVRWTYLLYLVFCLIGAGLASRVLWVGSQHGIADPSGTISAVGSPILLVPNDSVFLATIAPLSLMLLFRNPRSITGALSALSILLSAAAIILLQSRTALITMVVSLTCGIAFTQSKQRLALALFCGAL